MAEEQERITAILNLVRPDDSEGIKAHAKRLVVELAEQAADKAMKGGGTGGQNEADA